MPILNGNEFLDARNMPPEDLIFGRSPAMAAAREKLERVATTTIPVLLQGESGTGKDLFAKLLHIRSARSSQPCVKVSCPAIPSTLIESELFGYERGAFTGAYGTKRGRVEMAHQGTLFLDEVGSLDISAQAKLLQVLQDGSFMRVGGHEARKVNTRLVCAANEDLWKHAQDGTFRLDLFFRINAVTIDLPPLRHRSEDLPMLIDYFLNQHGRTFRVTPKPLSREVLGIMQRFHWPGNIRQLDNMIRTYLLIGNEEALVSDLIPAPPSEIIPQIDLDNPISLKKVTKAATRELERQIILRVLTANRWNRAKTAKWLSISYRSLLYKLQEVTSETNGRPIPKARPAISKGSPLSSHGGSPGTESQIRPM
jgi:two-component system response regulator AtoC